MSMSPGFNTMRQKYRSIGILHAEFAPALVAEELNDGVEGAGVGEAFVVHAAPDAFEGDVTQGDARLIEDHAGELEEILVVPAVAVAPPCFFLEEAFELPNQMLVHRYVLMVSKQCPA